jgi:hypothetical protein
MAVGGLQWPSIIHVAWHPIAPDFIAAAKRVHADLYIAHYAAALPAAAIAARHHDALYAFDAEDFHPGDAANGLARPVYQDHLQAIEERYLPGCVHMTASSPGFAKAYADAYGLPAPQVLLNVFPRTCASNGPTERGTTQPGPSLYWFSQTIGPDLNREKASSL